MKKVRQNKSCGGRQRVMKKEAVFGLIAACIPLVGYLIFSAFPLILSFVTMFVDMTGYQLDTMRWNNFANFKYVLTDATFWLSMRNTLILLTGQFVSLLIALVTAFLLAQKFRGTGFFTALFFVPYICSSVAITIIWMTMFNNDYGVINDILVRVFGETAKIQWYNRPVPFFMMLYIILIWQAPGYGIVMYKAAFTAVPRSLYEAARVDGAGEFKQFLYVTLPSIAPTSFFLIMAGIISGLQIFDVPSMVAGALGNGWTGAAGPDNAGLSTMLHIYNTGILFNKMPQAAVMSFILFLIVMALTKLNSKISERWGNNE